MRRGRFIQNGFFAENPIAALSNNCIEKAARNFSEKPGSSGIKPGKHFLNGPGAPKNPPFMEKHKIFQVRSILRFQQLLGRDPLKGGIEKLPPDVPFPHKIDKGIAKITNPVKKNNCLFSFLRHTFFIKPFKIFFQFLLKFYAIAAELKALRGLLKSILNNLHRETKNFSEKNLLALKPIKINAEDGGE